MRHVQHGRIRLALHTLVEREGPGLLLLHELGGRSPELLPPELGAWPGPVYALDFTGHGESSLPRGGGYQPEILMADVDAVLAEIGEATLLGRGLGAYVALLIAAARPALVRGAVLCDGAGLAGGGARPRDSLIPRAERVGDRAPDPLALVELAADIRPPDYAVEFAARVRSDLPRSISVCARGGPPWLEAILDLDGVGVESLSEALEGYAKLA